MITKRAAQGQGKITHSSQALGQRQGRTKSIKKKGAFELGSEGLFEVGSDKGRGTR